jgi:hypothetical protein
LNHSQFTLFIPVRHAGLDPASSFGAAIITEFPSFEIIELRVKPGMTKQMERRLTCHSNRTYRKEKNMQPSNLPPQSQLMQFILGKWISKPIYVAAELGIADMLAEGPQSIEALAAMSQSHAPTLYRVMRALAAVGIFSETEDKCFELTPMAECLKTGVMRSIALMFHADWHDRAWDNLLYGVKTGNPPFDKAHEKPAFEWFESHPQAARIYNEANALKAMKPGSKLLIVEIIIPAGNTFSIAKLLDLEVFVMGGGHERTEAEFKTLFESCGFSASRIIPTAEDISVIEVI